MINLKLKAVKNLFFDRQLILTKEEKGTGLALNAAGFKTMKRARGSIRSAGKKGKPSKPGKPPKNRTGLLRDNIFYIVDMAGRSVIVGPIKLNRSSGAQEVLEKGGTVKLSKRQAKAANRTTGKLEKRPYMLPAFDKTKEKFPQLWANSIK